MKRREDLYLVDIVEAAVAIEEFTKGITAETFSTSQVHQSAVVWQLIIIGEASNKIDLATRDLFHDIPWDQIRAFRNRLVHGYFDLNWVSVWTIASTEVPLLRRQVERILADQFPETWRKMRDKRSQK